MFNVKEAPWKVILVFLLVSTCMTALINLVLFPGPLFDPISNATSYLIDGTLQANLINILVFALIIFGWGKLRPIDVGLDWGKLAQGLCLTALLWLGMQGIVLLINWINGDIHLDPAWSERGVTRMIGGLIAQLLGNALFEEMEYRGFYLSQFYLKLKNQSGRQRLFWAVLSMLVLFVLSHIPNRIFFGYSLADIPLDFALLFAWGLFFTAIYLISGNLFLAIGVHALSNRPTLITEATFPPQALLFILTWILLAVLSFQKRQRRLQGEVEAFAEP
ncbi:MAG TPA: CPBP family intramembrane glutamic endopeptidase [Anaerolineales bacterium]|nr:CPBP family intramembrane glutamic endopeptidase [Anaerolineales bacterium]